jgi:hypothetical protein
VLVVAAYVGSTRLIDNEPLSVGRPSPPADVTDENSVGGEQ